MSKKYDPIKACIANVQYAIISSPFIFVTNYHNNSRYISKVFKASSQLGKILSILRRIQQ